MNQPQMRTGRTTFLACVFLFNLPFSDGTSCAQPADNVRVRESIEAFGADPAKLAALRRAIRRMRELEPMHPFSWSFQANIHWRPEFPDYLLEQANSPFAPAELRLFREDSTFTPTPDVFNQCPHGNWWFLPWHRAYLFYFERVLQWAADDDSLSLPYWNYSATSQRSLPEAFRQPAAADGCYNPLYLPAAFETVDANGRVQSFPMRNGLFNRGLTELASPAVALNALDRIQFVGSVDGDSFGGAPAIDLTERSAQGALEQRPHNIVHVAIGGDGVVVGDEFRIGYMSTPTTAARDPIFWLHHSNIDRLWEVWLNLQGGRENPGDSPWLDKTFTFFDVGDDGEPKPVTIAVRDLLSTSQLHYRYDDISRPVAPLLAQHAAHGIQARILASSRAPDLHSAAIHAHGHDDSTTKAISLMSATPTEVAVSPVNEAAGKELRLLAKDSKQQFVLALNEIELQGPTAAYYDVFLNRPANEEAAPESPHYAGVVTFFGLDHSHAHHGDHTVTLRFDVTKIIAGAADSDGPDLRVELIPQSATAPLAPTMQAIRGESRRVATVKSIELQVVPMPR